MSRSFVLAFALACSTALLPASDARACSRPACVPGRIVPSGGAVPENAVEFAWLPTKPSSPDAGAPEPPVLQRVQADGGVGEALSLDMDEPDEDGFVRLRPRVAIEQGATLALRYHETCGGGERDEVATVKVEMSAPKPTALGTLRSELKRGPLLLWASGSCTETSEVSYVQLATELAPAARPYADLIRYRLLVDGSDAILSYAEERIIWSVNRYAMSTPVPAGTDVLYARCDGAPSAPYDRAGEHRVKMVGTLPDGSELRTDEITVHVPCMDEGREVSGDGGTAVPAGGEADGSTAAADGAAASDLADEAGSAVDARASARSGEAGASDLSLEGSYDPGRADADADEQVGDGCSLSSSSERPGSLALALACTLVALARKRERRRERRTKARERAEKK